MPKYGNYEGNILITLLPFFEQDALFRLASQVPLIGWILLVFAPRWRWTNRVVRGTVVPLLAIGYVAIILARFGKSDGGFGSLADVQRLFADPYMLVAGWIHYLAFDLFIGTWIVGDAIKRGVPAWLRIIPLPLTFMFGPAGLLLYISGRLAYTPPSSVSAASTAS